MKKTPWYKAALKRFNRNKKQGKLVEKDRPNTEEIESSGSSDSDESELENEERHLLLPSQTFSPGSPTMETRLSSSKLDDSSSSLYTEKDDNFGKL